MMATASKQKEIIESWQVTDTLIVPIYTPYNRRLVGTMIVDDLPEPGPPSERAVEPLAIFADQAAIAI